MAISLKDNLTSSYFNAAHKLYSKKARRRIVAYVESYDDVAFWRTLLEEFEDEEHYFQVMLPSATSLAKGKKMVLMNTLNTAELGKSLAAQNFLLYGKINCKTVFITNFLDIHVILCVFDLIFNADDRFSAA